MWKPLKPGERVEAGDIVRYGPGLPHPIAFHEMVFDVIETDQHYFLVAVNADEKRAEMRDRTIIKYMDIGYNISLEIWSGKWPGVA